MIPSIEQLKKAAGKIADFIGQTHKVRIKHSTALEAMARAYDQDSWNALVALVENQAENSDISGRKHLASYVERPLFNNVNVLHKDWNKHTMAIGTASERRAWCLWQLGEHLSAIGQKYLPDGRVGIFVDVLDLDILTEAQYENLAQMLYIVDLNKPKEVLIEEMLAETRIIVLNTGSEQRAIASEELINAMLLSTRVKVDGTADAKMPLTICIYDYTVFKSRIGMWAGQLRAFNVALLCTTDELDRPDRTPVMNQVEANTMHKLYLNPRSDAARKAIDDQMSRCTCVIDTGQGLTIY